MAASSQRVTFVPTVEATPIIRHNEEGQPGPSGAAHWSTARTALKKRGLSLSNISGRIRQDEESTASLDTLEGRDGLVWALLLPQGDSSDNQKELKCKVQWGNCPFDTWNTERKLWWVNINRGHKEAQEWVGGQHRNQAKIGRENGEDFCRNHGMPACRLTSDSQGEPAVYLCLRGINLNPGCKAEDMVGLRCWITETKLITSRKERVNALARTKDMIMAREDTAPSSPGEIISVVILYLVHAMEAPIISLEHDFVKLEERSLTGVSVDAGSMRKDLNGMRLRMLKFCQYLIPQRDCLQQLVDIAQTHPFIFSHEAVETIIGAKSNHDSLTLRLKTMSYQAQNLQQELAALSQERLASGITKLTIISAAAIAPNMFLMSMAIPDSWSISNEADEDKLHPGMIFFPLVLIGFIVLYQVLAKTVF